MVNRIVFDVDTTGYTTGSVKSDKKIGGKSMLNSPKAHQPK